MEWSSPELVRRLPKDLGAALPRVRGDAQPTDPVRLVLLSPGQAFRPEAIARAIELANGSRIAVVVLARIHGSSFGFPNPGLMPNAKEKAAATDYVETALAAIRRSGGKADGQVAVARSASKVGARVAKLRQASVVVVDEGIRPGWRRAIEGDVSWPLRLRLRGTADVEAMS